MTQARRSSGVAPLLDVQGLTTAFRTSRHHESVAVDNVSFQVFPGEAVGVVGESGSGKSVTMLSIMGLIPKSAGRVVAGKAMFRGEDLLTLSERRLADIRGEQIAMIFQDPMTSLNPVFTIGRQISEPLVRHKGMSFGEAKRKVVELLEAVNIPSAKSRLGDYPHEFSGGMRQRVMIAMALACDPTLLIADEPTTALDVTVQAQILELIANLRRDFEMALIMVTHDLGVIAGTVDRVNVMYSGQIVETGTAATVFHRARHPYTLGLLQSVPRIDQESGSDLYAIPGRPPEITNFPVGCRFEPRCEFAHGICAQRNPDLLPVEAEYDHQIACWVDVRSRELRVLPVPVGGRS